MCFGMEKDIRGDKITYSDRGIYFILRLTVFIIEDKNVTVGAVTSFSWQVR